MSFDPAQIASIMQGFSFGGIVDIVAATSTAIAQGATQAGDKINEIAAVISNTGSNLLQNAGATVANASVAAAQQVSTNIPSLGEAAKGLGA